MSRLEAWIKQREKEKSRLECNLHSQSEWPIPPSLKLKPSIIDLFLSYNLMGLITVDSRCEKSVKFQRPLLNNEWMEPVLDEPLKLRYFDFLHDIGFTARPSIHPIIQIIYLLENCNHIIAIWSPVFYCVPFFGNISFFPFPCQITHKSSPFKPHPGLVSHGDRIGKVFYVVLSKL